MRGGTPDWHHAVYKLEFAFYLVSIMEIAQDLVYWLQHI